MPLGIRLYNYLLQNPSITDLVSNRIYPLTPPDASSMPYLTFRIVSGSCEYALDGNSGQGKTKIQISIFFDDYVEANNIAVVLETEMEKWPQSDSSVQIITQVNYSQLYDKTEKTMHIDIDFDVYAKNQGG